MKKKTENILRYIAAIIITIAGYALIAWRPFCLPLAIFAGILACNKIMPQD